MPPPEQQIAHTSVPSGSGAEEATCPSGSVGVPGSWPGNV